MSLGEKLVHDIGSGARKLGDEILGHPEASKSTEPLFDYNSIPPIAMPSGFPWHSLPSVEWAIQLGVVVLKLQENTKSLSREQGGSSATSGEQPSTSSHPLAHIEGQGLTEAGILTEVRNKVESLDTEGLGNWFGEMLKVVSDVPNALQEPTASLECYEKLFSSIDLPAIAGTFQRDDVFANQRVAGPNPTSLFRVKGCLPAKFPVTNALFQSVQGTTDNLTDALKSGRLYMLDYAGQEPAVNGTYPNVEKFAEEPMALFVVPKAGGTSRALVPIAIQCGQDPTRYELVDPSGGGAWMLAKTVVQVADGNFHELVAHLGRTHLLLAPFPAATTAWLGEAHPLRVLLTPHFEGTEFINWAAAEFLVAPKGNVDQLLSGTIDADRTASVKVSASRGFNASFLPVWLKRQNIHDPQKLPNYPFRDDGMLIWNSIGQWAQDYVQVYWPNDKAVDDDTELQSWAAELHRFNGGRIADFGDQADGVIRSACYLASAIQMIIWTASGMHAAVNFPQGDIMDYAPAMPLAGYASSSGAADTEKSWFEYLPPISQAHAQLNLLYLLGNVHHTQLGQYDTKLFDEPKVVSALQQFQASLVEVAKTIDVRNLSRPNYEYLLPKNIPQSINI